ncbi:MAG: alpha-glucuronidase family glycosyl hydrolase [Bacteroidota bacterium]|nr:alpha-glucuronidase family glycosyl hydrolase [Bacteroidota bacterium]
MTFPEKISAGKLACFLFLLLALIQKENLLAENGYRLWLRYDKIDNSSILNSYDKSITGWIIEGNTPVLNSAASELQEGLSGLLGKTISRVTTLKRNGIILAGTPGTSRLISNLKLDATLAGLGNEGFLITDTVFEKKKIIIIASKSDLGVLYGTFHFLRLLQTRQDISHFDIRSSPKIMIRILDHWDNLDRSVERGYAGLSIWNWNSLPDSISKRYIDYARANASIGINATVLTNVNANSLALTREYLVKVASLADIFRKYGIKVYLTARFSSPVEIGKLKTADPLDPSVIDWWKNKVDEIYSIIPDFGGLLVKANSEGQPGPQTYNRTHADGANMLADALAPHKGIVMWRAFVYDNNVPDDRAKQAYNEFVPLDGKFRKNVLVQVKNGPVDFQPREPFHPLFGAMPGTQVMPEFQITQEYLGGSVHLVFLAPLFEECLKSDTWSKGAGSTVAKIIDGTLYGQQLTGMAGVSNIGSADNWTGHPFAQANWYAFGRLAWDPYMNSTDIASEWIRMTFTNNSSAVGRILGIMLSSREATVNYMTPLGLHHIMYYGHHYGPGPWVNTGRKDWTSVYYHRADSIGLGFDRSTTGSNAVSQYFPAVREIFNNIESCPENLFLWFHHVPWDYKMRSGRTLWEELCRKYDDGIRSVRRFRSDWDSLRDEIDPERFEKVKTLLAMQERDARIWRDGCLLYFQTFSKKPFPAGFEKPEHKLDYYMNYKYTDIPGIK